MSARVGQGGANRVGGVRRRNRTAALLHQARRRQRPARPL